MSHFIMNHSQSQQKKGFSLLLAVLLGSLLISVGLGIFNLTFKESIISASGRESEYALYAADSGIDCALYYDIQAGSDADRPFSVDTDFSQARINNWDTGGDGPIKC